MSKQRLDQQLVAQGLVSSRSQAESYIKLGTVSVNGRIVSKPGTLVTESAQLKLQVPQQYVSRAALKLASVAASLGLNFSGTSVLDVGSSTGGFTDYALRHGARAVVAVELGTDQLHPSLRLDSRVTLYEKTDIRDVAIRRSQLQAAPHGKVFLAAMPDIIVADVSFVSLRSILPHLAQLSGTQTKIVVMLKPQFEAAQHAITHHGVIKNDTVRREIMKSFEQWVAQRFIILAKADSEVAGAKGNKERFYLLKKIAGAER